MRLGALLLLFNGVALVSCQRSSSCKTALHLFGTQTSGVMAVPGMLPPPLPAGTPMPKGIAVHVEHGPGAGWDAVTDANGVACLGTVLDPGTYTVKTKESGGLFATFAVTVGNTAATATFVYPGA